MTSNLDNAFSCDFVGQEAASRHKGQPKLTEQLVRPNILSESPKNSSSKHTDSVKTEIESTGFSKVKSLMRHLWYSDSFKDLAIFTSDMKSPIYCHASVLSIVSSYTKALIKSSGLGSDQLSLCLPDVSHDTTRYFLQMLYGLDKSECKEAFDASEINYLIAALQVDLGQAQTKQKQCSMRNNLPMEFDCTTLEYLKSEPSSPQHTNPFLSEAHEATMLCDITITPESGNENEKSELEPNGKSSYVGGENVSIKHESKKEERLSSFSKVVNPTDEKPFTCSICEQKFALKKSLRRHQILHTDKAINCSQCDKKFINSRDLKRHEESHSRGTTRLLDTKPEERFHYISQSEGKALGPHQPEREEQCPPDEIEVKDEILDNTVDKGPSNLPGKSRYWKSMEKIPNQTDAQCDKCPQVLRGKRMGRCLPGSLESKLRRHYKNHHDENLPFKCDLCDYRALTFKSIKNHKGNLHTSNKHQCRQGCGKDFTLENARDRHEKRWCSKSVDKERLILEEKESGSYTKELEKVKLRALKTKERQKRLKADPKSFLTCELCGQCTDSQDDLLTHMKKVHDNKDSNASIICKKNSKNLKERRKELCRINGKMVSKEFIQCDKCPYFGTNIDQHQGNHHNPDLPHGCQLCGYRALTDFAITMHTAKVHKEKKFQCKLGCGKTFENQWYAGFHEKRYCTYSKVKDKLIQKETEDGRRELHKKRAKKVRIKHTRLTNMLKDQKECTACHICGQLLSKSGFKLHFTNQHPNESIK